MSQKIINAKGLNNEQLRISLVQEKPYLFSDDYLVEIVGRGQSVLKAETLKILVGPKEMARIRVEVR